MLSQSAKKIGRKRGWDARNLGGRRAARKTENSGSVPKQNLVQLGEFSGFPGETSVMSIIAQPSAQK